MKLASLAVAVILAVTLPGALAGATIYTAVLSGANEVPPSGSAGTGTIVVTLSGDMLSVNEVFSGLTVPATAAHIHCCAPIGMNASVAVPFTGFPNATSGTYMQTFNLTLLSSYNGSFVTANGGTAASAEAALIAGLNTGQTYANIHDPTFPGGEIRGQLGAVPEPATLTLAGAGLAGLLLFRRRR